MITITLHCGMCGKEKTVFLSSDILGRAEDLIREVALRGDGIWIVQNNDGIIDTYCSKKCAE